MSEPLPQVIGGRYQLVRKLGQGGMGAVYEAIDAATGQKVAVKTIIAELSNNKTLMGRFEREARAAAALDTPHIAAVLDSGRDEAAGISYMIMEYLDGEDLQQILRRLGPIAPDLALRIAAQACLALQKAHDKRIVHRDIKPANFFLARREGGQRLVKLLDFGVAKVRKEAEDAAETKGLTRTGSMLGSPLYMSPEQARGHKDLDQRSDLWSLGVVLYQALAGRTPHGDTDELGELIILICTEPAEPIQDVAPWVPPEIAAIVHRAMRFSPAERFASAAEMLAAITPLLRGSMAIDEAMLRPLSDAERLTIAPRLAVGVQDAPPPRRAGSTASGTAAGHAQGGEPLARGGTLALEPPPSYPSATPYPAVPPAVAPGPTSSTLSASAVGATLHADALPAPAARSSRAPLLFAGIGALALFGGIGAFVATRRSPEPAPAVASAAPPPPATDAADKVRVVKLVVLPDDVKAEVDGAPVTPKEGVIEIRGKLGSEHRVRLYRSGPDGGIEGELEKDVAVTENGPSPAKLDLSTVAPSAPAAASSASAGKRLGGPLPKPHGPVLRNDR